MEKEVWKDVPNYEGYYQVSNFGRLKRLESIVRYGHGLRTVQERFVGGNGKYKRTALCKHGKSEYVIVHVLVAICFLDHKKTEGLVVDHIDNNPKNNHVDNLQIITQRENSTKDRKNKSSKYRGCFWNKHKSKWQAQMYLQGKLIVLGKYDNEFQAHLIYEKKLKEICSK